MVNQQNNGIQFIKSGFFFAGDQVNKDDSFKPIVDYIDSQYELYLQEELKIKRNLNSYHDSR